MTNDYKNIIDCHLNYYLFENKEDYLKFLEEENEEKNIVKFSRLLYHYLCIDNYDYDYVIEFEVNGELKLWYNDPMYQGWEKPNYFNEKLSDHCILQNCFELPLLFRNSPITHFENILPNIRTSSYMFENCKDLIYFKSKMNNVKYTNGMFEGCSDEFFDLHPHLRDL